MYSDYFLVPFTSTKELHDMVRPLLLATASATMLQHLRSIFMHLEPRVTILGTVFLFRVYGSRFCGTCCCAAAAELRSAESCWSSTAVRASACAVAAPTAASSASPASSASLKMRRKVSASSQVHESAFWSEGKRWVDMPHHDVCRIKRCPIHCC